MTDAIKMQLSAFVDGELSDAESELLIRRIGRDAELRATIAEYHAIGRIMRAEAEPAGMDRLLAGIRDGIDADTPEEADVAEPAATRTYVRPLTGFAVAASVALIGVLGVTQWTPGDATDNSYTVPDPALADVFPRHGATAGEFEALLTTLEIRQEELEVADEAEPSEDDESESADE